MRKYFLLLLIAFCSAFNLMAEKWTTESLPMPYLQDARLHVCNPDNVLSALTVDSINSILTQLEHDKGIQTIVVAVKQLEGDDPYSFCMQLGRKYGIGSKRQRTGLIVLLATEDRSYQILTGNGLEGSLPDAICRRIQNKVMVPALKENNWDGAMLNTIRSISSYVRDDGTLKSGKNTDDDDAEEAFIAALVIGITTIVTIIVVLASRKKCSQCGRRMKKISTCRVRHPLSNKWVYRTLWQCPRCGHSEHTYTDDTHVQNGNGFPPIFLGGSSGSSSSGSFGGGVFGGGTFGGGGSGGRF